MTREDIELYVSGNFDGDVAAFERAIAEDEALAAQVADEARFEMLLRDAAAAATFCPACEELVRGERCDACGAALRPGGYVVERVLVSNAHGRMYVARDADGKHVALKELAFVQAPAFSTIEAFEREAKLLRALEHPAIPRFVASFEEGRGVHTRYYLAQELVDGTSLDRIDDHWYTEAEIVDIARRVLAIIAYLQSLSPIVIHRDIKPANLIKRADGSIALVDFGAAYVHGSTAGATTVGTFGYMPVEQLAGIVDATTDVYALGASLLFLLTRQEPWRLAQNKVTINVSPRLRAWLDKLVAPDPRDRFVSARDALAQLDRGGVDVPAHRRRDWVRPALIAAATLALAGSGTAVYHLVANTRVEPEVSKPVLAANATLRIAMPENVQADLFVDGERSGWVRNALEVPVPAGRRKIKIAGPNGAVCEHALELPAGKTTVIECNMPQRRSEAAGDKIRSAKLVSWDFKSTPLREVILLAAQTCDVDFVVPSYVDGTITANVVEAPCGDAMQMILQSNGLGVRYSGDVARVASNRELERDIDEELLNGPSRHPRLPAFGKVTAEAKSKPLRDALQDLARHGPIISLVIPSYVDGSISYKLADVPWEDAFEAVLAANGLWYRYLENDGVRLVRIASKRELDQEP